MVKSMQLYTFASRRPWISRVTRTHRIGRYDAIDRDFIVHQIPISYVAAVNFKIRIRWYQNPCLGACMQIHLSETPSYWFQAPSAPCVIFFFSLLSLALPSYFRQPGICLFYLFRPSFFLPRLFIRALFAEMASTFVTLFLSSNLSQPVCRASNSPSSPFTEEGSSLRFGKSARRKTIIARLTITI